MSIVAPDAHSHISRLGTRAMSDPHRKTLLVNTSSFSHPVASMWQRCLNAMEIPPSSEQRDLANGVLVLARWVWERDGEERIEGRVVSVWKRRGYEDVVLVHRLTRDARGQTHGEWLRASDVEVLEGGREATP